MSALDTTEHTPHHKPPRRSRHPSTTSIRSTASARSPRPTVWRPPNSLRVRNDSLSSATDARLSVIVAGAELSGNTVNVRDRMEALHFTAPVAGPSSPAPSATSDLPHEIPEISEADSDVTSLATLTELADKPILDGTNLIAFPPSVSPPASRASSWFGSISRAKGKEKLAEVHATASTPNLLAPASSIPIPVPDAAPSPSASEPVTSSGPGGPERPDPFLLAFDAQSSAAQRAAGAAKRSWFSSSPVQPSPLRATSPPQPIPHPIHIPSAEAAFKEDIVPSSIDSSVPSPVATPTADVTVNFPLSEEGHETVRGRQRLASLNPSMGRFGINLPLLGGSRAAGPTVPTEDGNTIPTTVDGTITTAHYASETLETVNQDSTTLTVKTDTLQTTTTTSHVGSTTRDVNAGPTMEQHSSWWDYVSWHAPPPPSTAAQDHTAPEEEGGATPKPPAQSFPEVPDVPPALPESATPAPSSDDDSKTLSPRTVPAISVSHEDQASWYYPWAWYGTNSSGSTMPSPVAPTGSGEEKPVEAQLPDGAQSTPVPIAASTSVESAAAAAQQRYWTSFFTYSQPTAGPQTQSHVNEPVNVTTSESLPNDIASPDSAASARPPIPHSPSSLSLGANPIGDSISSNRTGWVSFFSSSATLGYVSKKPITSGEPEVMEIDLDEGNDASQTAAALVPPVAAETTDKSKKEPEGKDLKPSKEDETPRPNGSLPASKATKPTPTKPAAPPLTISDSVKRQVANNNGSGSINSKRSASPSPSVTSKKSTTSKPPSIAPPRTPTPNLVLPTWSDTFHAPPRSVLPQRLLDANGKTVTRAVMEKTMKFVSGVLFAADSPGTKGRSSSASRGKGKGTDREEREREKKYEEWGLGLPRSWDILKPAAGKAHPEAGDLKEGDVQDVLRGCKHVVVIGIHGWFPGAVMRSVLGEPTGTSTKFVNMMVSALEEFQAAYNVTLETVTCIPLEGEGTIERRVEKLYSALTANAEWLHSIHTAEVIFVATHSQGSIVSTHLLDRLIRDGHIRTGGPDVSKEPGSPGTAPSTSAAATLPPPPPQRVCCLALCGIHLGPLRYLSSSSLVLPYLQYFESAAAKELFEFQNTESEVSKAYVKALANVVDNGTKMVYIASLNDQVVPLYSGLFTAASHPLILRALYIDGDAYHSSDFLSNLLVLLLRILNSGLPESGLIAHLSEATAGSLNGVGHSTVYEELSTYSLVIAFLMLSQHHTYHRVFQAVKYLFLTNSGFDTHPKLAVEPFNANTEQNDYEIPWSLRDLIADERVAHFFSKEITQLAAAFRHWHPKTSILRDVKRKLQPIQRLPATMNDNTSVSKL